MPSSSRQRVSFRNVFNLADRNSTRFDQTVDDSELKDTAGQNMSISNLRMEKKMKTVDVDCSTFNGDRNLQPFFSKDETIVGWDLLENDGRATNWTIEKKWLNIGTISAITFLTPLASSMIAPGIPMIMREFDNTNETVASFIVSIYILGYAIGPLFLAPMSELYGRLIVYHMCNISFVVWNLACAFAPSTNALLAFRLLAGFAGSCPITIGAGSIADVFEPAKRGAAMAIFAAGPLLGPVIGPVAGGYLAQTAGWRWVFWLITVAGGCFSVISLCVLSETYEPVLLEIHVKKLRATTENPELRSVLALNISRRQHFMRAIIRPTKLLFLSPIVALFSIYVAVVYGYLYLVFTTLTLVFEGVYGFDQGSVGLTFLGIGVGSILGLIVFGVVSDRLVIYMTARNGGKTKPEFRLPPLIPGSLILPIGLFWYGWSVQERVHWIMPVIGTAWIGFGMLATLMPIQTYLVDTFNLHSASAVAANAVLRSLMGAFLPLAGPQMYHSLGYGWGNSLLAFIALIMVPIPIIFYRFGERMRTSPKYQVSL